MSDLRSRNLEKLADDMRKMVRAAVEQQPANDIYERCQIVAHRIDLIIDAALIEGMKQFVEKLKAER